MDWIIGIGNRMRGDDGLGPVLVDRLEATLGVRTCSVDQLTAELAEDLSTADRVLFVDATAGENGIELKPIAPRPARGLGHALPPEGLLELTARAFGRAPAGWLLAIPGRLFGWGECLSEEAEACLFEAEATLQRWVQRAMVMVGV